MRTAFRSWRSQYPHGKWRLQRLTRRFRPQTDARAALEQPFEVALIDVKMPDLDGIELTRLIKSEFRR